MSNAEDVRIESLDHLKRLSAKNALECYIALSHWMRSSKVVCFHDPGWWVMHMVDDSEVEHEDDEDLMLSGIGEAIKKGSLYAYVYEYMSKKEVKNLAATQSESAEKEHVQKA